MKPWMTTTGAVCLTALGCLQMVGDLTGFTPLKALGAASHASPAPRVFTAHEGFETFASDFYLHWQDKNGEAHSLQLTPSVYKRIAGPYNRRNAYGAAISYGPVLAANPATQPMFHSVSRYALCGKAPVLRELGIDPDTLNGPVTVELKPQGTNQATRQWQLTFQIGCNKETIS